MMKTFTQEVQMMLNYNTVLLVKMMKTLTLSPSSEDDKLSLS
jgi:hypothetical protein